MSHAEGGSFYSDWQIFPIASIVSLRLLVWVFTDYVAGAGGLGLHVSQSRVVIVRRVALQTRLNK